MKMVLLFSLLLIYILCGGWYQLENWTATLLLSCVFNVEVRILWIWNSDSPNITFISHRVDM